MRAGIQHVFVLMLENRSFDHMLGFLPREGHLASLEGLSGDEFNLLDTQDPRSQRFYVRPEAPYAMPEDLDPDHSLLAVNYQLTGSTEGPNPYNPARNDGFVENFAYAARITLGRAPTDAEIQLVMDCFGPGQLPMMSQLAQQYCVCDHWFSDVPGPTMPNRLFVHAATSHGVAVNEFQRPFPIPTIYQRLEEAGLSWRTYFSNLNDLVQFPKLVLTPDNNRLFSRFEEDVANSDAATYAFIQPSYLTGHGPGEVDNSDHAPADVRYGEQLITTVYNALRQNEELWSKSLLILTFDEHGGFYDHVVPPFGVANPDGLRSIQPPFDFRRLGLRVPSIVISPWIRPQVDSTVYSHSTIPATIKELFDLPHFLTRRDATANTLIPLIESAGELRDDTPARLEANIECIPDEDGDKPLSIIQRQLLHALAHLNPARAHEHQRAVEDLPHQAAAHDFVRDLWQDHFTSSTSSPEPPEASASVWRGSPNQPKLRPSAFHSPADRKAEESEDSTMSNPLASAIASRLLNSLHASRNASRTASRSASNASSPSARALASAVASHLSRLSASRNRANSDLARRLASAVASKIAASCSASRSASRGTASASRGASSAASRTYSASRGASRSASRGAASASKGASRSASRGAASASKGASRSASSGASKSASRGAASASKGASRSASRGASRSASRGASRSASRGASRSASRGASRSASRGASRSA
ncbi:MAG: hypothetical protein K0U98_15745, partial [Deltaproteobacteria bacterium]|nr:hypothetical protein [Deltaproteobacteria bacterium]